MQRITALLNKKDHPAQVINRRLHSRAMMIWRQMENIYGGSWIRVRGPRTKSNGSLSYVAETWTLVLGRYSDIHIRMALAVLAEQYKESPCMNVISVFSFRDIVERVAKH